MDRVGVGSTDPPVLQRSVPTEEIQGLPLALAEGSTPAAVRGSRYEHLGDGAVPTPSDCLRNAAIADVLVRRLSLASRIAPDLGG